MDAFLRWLIDTNKDDEGMRVIADLHGGDLDNPVATAEFREIKHKVLMEVSTGFHHSIMNSTQMAPSVIQEKLDRMQPCGENISDECCWQCPRRPLPNL
jgi:hypothetical protein